jgi:hypothetical protein
MRRDGYRRVFARSHVGSGCFACESHRSSRCESFRRNRVIPAMTVTTAGIALFLNVGNFATGGQLAILANHAPTTERREPEKPNETHHVLRYVPITGSAICVPLRSASSPRMTPSHIGAGATSCRSSIWTQKHQRGFASNDRACASPLRAAVDAGSSTSASPKYLDAASGSADCRRN